MFMGTVVFFFHFWEQFLLNLPLLFCLAFLLPACYNEGHSHDFSLIALRPKGTR